MQRSRDHTRSCIHCHQLQRIRNVLRSRHFTHFVEPYTSEQYRHVSRSSPSPGWVLFFMTFLGFCLVGPRFLLPRVSTDLFGTFDMIFGCWHCITKSSGRLAFSFSFQKYMVYALRHCHEIVEVIVGRHLIWHDTELVEELLLHYQSERGSFH